jgi:hypothetical protein
VLYAAVTKVGDQFVRFVGVGTNTMSGWTLEEADFVRLANAAVERVRLAL